ncbi:hypothetical protein AAFN86_16585 [Roseomonas sp. CAU 1739]|uniref:hypothetical protein n=1 Tax=Roseomonas sp. CAU 1739 TaxID=3140364 RepID=UPI00325AA17F
MNGALLAFALMLGAAAAALAITACVAAWRAVRIGGARLLFNSWDWFIMSDDVPAAARPHMRRALLRWCGAMGCMVLAVIAAALSGALA